MKKKYYFISGLPRFGFTLLISILNQNPKFYAEISSRNVLYKNEECGRIVSLKHLHIVRKKSFL